MSSWDSGWGFAAGTVVTSRPGPGWSCSSNTLPHGYDKLIELVHDTPKRFSGPRWLSSPGCVRGGQRVLSRGAAAAASEGRGASAAASEGRGASAAASEGRCASAAASGCSAGCVRGAQRGLSQGASAAPSEGQPAPTQGERTGGRTLGPPGGRTAGATSAAAQLVAGRGSSMGRICCHTTGPFAAPFRPRNSHGSSIRLSKASQAEQLVERALLGRVGGLAQLVDPVVKAQPAWPPQPGDVISRILTARRAIDRTQPAGVNLWWRPGSRIK